MDHLVSSLSNVLLFLVVARWVEPDQLGLFAVVFAATAVFIGVVRGTVGTFVLVFPSSKADATHRSLATLVLVVAVFAASAAVVGSLFIEEGAAGLVVVLALLLPGVLYQEFGRNLAFSAHAPNAALRSDALWLVALVVFLAPARAVADPLEAAAWAWGMAALLALLPLRRFLPKPGKLGALMGHGMTNLRLLAMEAASLAVANNVLTHIVAAVAGLPAAGSLRLARTLYGPVSAVMSGLESVLTPRAAGAEQSARSLRDLWRLMAASVAVLAAATLIGLRLSDPLGTAMFDTNWILAVPLFLPLSLALAASGISMASVLVLRVTDQMATSAVGKSVLGALAVVAGGAGAAANGAEGAAWSAVGVNGLAAAWFAYRARGTVLRAATGREERQAP